MTENRPKPGPRPVEYPSFLKKRRTLDRAVGTEAAHIAAPKGEPVRGSEVAIPLIETTTAHTAASSLPDESLVLAGRDPVQSVTQGVTKPWRSHPAFAPRTAQPKIVEAASTPAAKTWRLHPAFAFRSQPVRVKSSAVVESALTIKQASEVADLAPPVTWPSRSVPLPQKTVKPAPFQVATRPPTMEVPLPTPVVAMNASAPPKPADELDRERSISHAYRPSEPTRKSPCPFCVQVVSSVPWPSFLPPRYRCTRPDCANYRKEKT